jgi:hypothetical protein
MELLAAERLQFSIAPEDSYDLKTNMHPRYIFVNKLKEKEQLHID